MQKAVYQLRSNQSEVNSATLNASIVLVGSPSVGAELYSALLPGQGVVPGDWRFTEPPMSTPVVSELKYQNGIVMTLGPGKLMVLSSAPESQLMPPEIVKALLERFPEWQLLAVGINMSVFLEQRDPEGWITERFLRPSVGSLGGLNPLCEGVKLKYTSETGDLHVGFEAGVKKTGDVVTAKGVLINFNEHNPVGGKDFTNKARAVIARYGRQVALYTRMVNEFLGKEN